MQRLSLIVTMLLYCCFSIAQSQVSQETFSQLLNQAKVQKKPILLHFTAMWCEPCKYQEKMLLSKDEVRKEIEDKYIYRKLDIEISKNKTLQHIYDGREVVPMFLVVDESGVLLNCVLGVRVEKEQFFREINRRFDTLCFPSKSCIHNYISAENDGKFNMPSKKQNIPLAYRLISKKWNLGIEAGIRFSYHTGDCLPMYVGYQAGFVFEHRLSYCNKKGNQIFIFRPSVILASTGGGYQEASIRRHIMEVPITLGIDICRFGLFTCPQPLKFYFSPYGQYAFNINRSDLSNRWDVGIRNQLIYELGSFEIGGYYDFGFLNQAKQVMRSYYNRSLGVNIAMIIR